MSAVEILNNWGEAWVTFMTRALLGSSVLLAVVIVIWVPLRRRMSAQFAYGLFLLVLLKLVVPIPVTWPSWTSALSIRRVAIQVSEWAVTPALPVPLPVSETVDTPIVVAVAPEPIVAPAESQANAPRPAAAVDRSEESHLPPPKGRAALTVPGLLLLVWAVVTSVLLIRFARACRNTRRLLIEAVPVQSWTDDFPLDLEALRRVAGVRSRVRWAISPRMTSPAVGGLVRPTIVMPPDLSVEMTPKQLTWVLLHELAHIRRGDLWVLTAQRLMQAVFFFHPAVHLTTWIIDQLREYACDDAALAAGHASRRDCGEGFLTIVGRTVDRSAAAPATALGLFDSRMLIRHRLIRILDSRRTVQGRLTRRATLILLVMALVVLPYARIPEAAADFAERNRRAADRLALDEPRIYALGRSFLHDDRERSAGSPRRPVLAIAYSPGGRLLASAGEDAAIVVRNVATGAILARLEGHRDVVTCLAFSPDGTRLASGGYDTTLRLWETVSFQPRGTLSGHTNWIFAVAFSPDGKTLASAGSDKTVRLWDVASARGLSTLGRHTSAVRALAFSPDGITLASGGADQEAILWDIRTKAAKFNLRGHRGTIRALTFSPDGTGIATAGEDGEVKLWDLRSGRERATMTGHSDMVLCLAFSRGGSTLASGGLDSALKLWDPQTGRERATLYSHGEAISALAFSPDARQIATTGYDGSLTLWDPAAPTLSAAAVLEAPDEALDVAFSPDGKRLYRSGKAEAITTYDPAAGLPLASLAQGGMALATAPDGKTLAIGGKDGKVRLIDVATHNELATLGQHSGIVRSVAFSPQGHQLVSAGQDGKVMLWNVATRTRLKSPVDRPRSVSTVRFSPDGKSLAIVSADLALVDLASGTERVVRAGGESEVAAVAFSPDGKTLASAGDDGLILFHETATFAEPRSIKDQDCTGLVFSSDGRSLISSRRGGELVLWSSGSGRKLATLKGHTGPVFGLAFSADGKTLASAGNDKTVRLWNLEARRLAPKLSLKSELGCLGPVVLSPDGKTLAVGEIDHDSSGDIALWDVATRRVRAVLEGHEHGVVSLVFSPDGMTLASSSSDRTIRLWNPTAGVLKGELSPSDTISRLAFAPDGKTLASAGLDKVLTLWEVDEGREIARLEGFLGAIAAVAFSPDGRLIATGGGGRDGRKDAFGEVKVFDAEDLTEVANLTGHTGSVLTLSFASDGQSLISGGFDATVRIWDVASGKTRLSLGGFPNCVRAIGVSPDGRTLAVAARGDGVVMLFDALGGGEIARLVGHGNTVLGLAFSPDGRTLTTGGLDRSIKMWDVPKPPVGTSQTVEH